MKEIRCRECNRYLCKLSFGALEIKCPSCKAVNRIEIVSYRQLLTEKPDSHTIGAHSSQKGT